MGKIIASYLVKLHVHAPDGADDAELEELTNDGAKAAIIAGVSKELGDAEISVSLIERTDD